MGQPPDPKENVGYRTQWVCQGNREFVSTGACRTSLLEVHMASKQSDSPEWTLSGGSNFCLECLGCNGIASQARNVPQKEVFLIEEVRFPKPEWRRSARFVLAAPQSQKTNSRQEERSFTVRSSDFKSIPAIIKRCSSTRLEIFVPDVNLPVTMTTMADFRISWQCALLFTVHPEMSCV